MLKKLLPLTLCIAFSSAASADMIGVYKSKDDCKLTVEALQEERGYTDGIYRLRSDGTGACEWTGMGIAKKTFIDGGIASGSTRGFVEMHWKFGPAGGEVEVTFFEPDGSVRLKESYSRM